MLSPSRPLPTQQGSGPQMGFPADAVLPGGSQQQHPLQSVQAAVTALGMHMHAFPPPAPAALAPPLLAPPLLAPPSLLDAPPLLDDLPPAPVAPPVPPLPLSSPHPMSPAVEAAPITIRT